MNLPDTLLPFNWYAIAHFLAAAFMLRAAMKTPWHRFSRQLTLNLWLGGCVALMTLWTMKTGIRPGLNFHLLGATAMTLMFGPELAVVGMAVILAGSTAFGYSDWQSYSMNLLLMGILPVRISYGIYWLVDKKLPNHFFVYIFLNAFLGAAIAIASTGLVSSLILAMGGAYTFDYLKSSYLPYFILMGWSEALLSGMALTLMVVYRPDWVSTFDDARYIHNK